MRRGSAGGIASSAVRRAQQATRREDVAALLDQHPHISTDEIADIIGVDRSTIRRDRKMMGLALARGSTSG